MPDLIHEMIAEKAVAIPYRIANGELLVALITARSDGRWVLPKGNIDAGEAAHEAAARETTEEAGLIVEPRAEQFGRCFHDASRRRVLLRVFALPVIEELEEWKEAHIRDRRWATPCEAAALVRVPGLKRLLLRLERHLQIAA